MDWNAVKELAGFYAAAGLADTRSGRFLTEVSESQVARGGAVSWLQTLLEVGDPQPWVALARPTWTMQVRRTATCRASCPVWLRASVPRTGRWR